jgi:HAD superfamily hydrolase (TIGR01484 family)
VTPLSVLASSDVARLRGILFDLDDTLLTHGVLTREAYDALWALHDAGLVLIVATGRPSGWGAVLARQWPVHGCVTENGAIHVVRDGASVSFRDRCTASERSERRHRLECLVNVIRGAVPEARLTDDATARRSDVAWDVGERERLPEARVRRIVQEIERAGARYSLSSVHLHATFDGDDKASGAVRFCVEELGEDATAVLTRFAFVGDSGNDAPCFSAFVTTFAVANVRQSLRRLTSCPRFVSGASMGQGFAEIAAAILAKR